MTRAGGALTLRWYTDRGRLYWISYDRARDVSTLRVTEDGDHWSQVTFPPDGGHPTDLTRFRDGLVVLTTRGLWRIDGAVPMRLAVVPRGAAGGPFDLGDPYCAAPLAVYRNASTRAASATAGSIVSSTDRSAGVLLRRRSR